MTLKIFAMTLLASLPGFLNAGESPLKIGWDSREIRFDKPVGMAGHSFARTSLGSLDPITTTALVLDNSKDTVIFISIDVCVIRDGLYDAVIGKLNDAGGGVPVDKIIMNATHTHAGPAWRDDDSNQVVSGIIDHIASVAADAVATAWKTRSPGAIAWGFGYAVSGFNRRAVYFDDTSKRPNATAPHLMAANGNAIIYGNSNDPQFSHYENGADPTVNFLYTFSPDGNLTGAIVNAATPAQATGGLYLSADFYHDFKQMIKKRHGNVFILPQVAGAGDTSPFHMHYKKAVSRRFELKYGKQTIPEHAIPNRLDIAERLAWTFDEVLSWARKDIRNNPRIVHLCKTTQLSCRKITDDEVAQLRVSIQKLKERQTLFNNNPKISDREKSRLSKQFIRATSLLQRYEKQSTDPVINTTVHVVAVDDIAFASNRFELFTDYMHRIQARSPFTQTFIIELAGVPGNDGGTYLATAAAAANKGYSASPFCNLVSPVGGQQLVEETLKLLADAYPDNK